MPFVVIWVIWDLVIMDILTGSEYSSNLNEMPRVDLSWSSSLVSQVGWNPTSIDDNGGSLNFYGVTVVKELLE